MLIEQDEYLRSGVHIGTRMKSGSMRKYIYRTRDDGLHVLDLKKLDERVLAAAKLLARFPAAEVYAVGSKSNAEQPINKFCELTGCQSLAGRFTPGTFTNPLHERFREPKLLLVVDPGVDRQAVIEAFQLNIPVIALCDTNNSTRFVDLAVPGNNKGRKALGLLFWLLARETLKASGKISSNEEFTHKTEEFEG
ncbi:MAG: 30S ribosomal protein S2 [Candidatus Micrarchaeia archaeon]